MSDFTFEDDQDDPEGWITDPFFEQVFDVPLSEVTDFPQSCVSINAEWVPLIISALERLKYGDMWAGDLADVQRAASNIDTLQAMLAQGDCPGGNMDYTCYDMPLFSPIITWLPADPFRDPDGVPFGYICPPFRVEQFANPIAGTLAGDVVVNVECSLFGFPPVVPFSGVPRVQIAIEGPADIDIEFVKVFQGGICVIFVDGVPHEWEDLQLYSLTDLLNIDQWSDLFFIGLEALTKGVQQHQVSITDPGPHTIEVQFFPRVSLDTNLGAGGGIRSIQICSAEEQFDMTGIITDVRINGGTIEKFVDAAWQDVDVVDDADVLTEGELRGNGCSLEYYDLTDQQWHTIPDTDFLKISDTCPITDQLIVVTNQNNGIQLQNPITGEKMYWNQTGTVGSITSTNILRLAAGTSVNALYLYNDGHIRLTTQYGSVETLGALSMRNFMNEATLRLRAMTANPTNQLEIVDNAARVTNEINLAGWFSAIQQLIVNDWSSTGTKRAQGRVLGQWADSTDATRKGRLIAQVDDFAGVREALRAESDGSQALLGFYGGAAAAQPVIAGADVAAALASLLTGLSAINLIDDQTAIPAALPYGEGVMETTYEAYWDFTAVFPHGFVWSPWQADWTFGRGFNEIAGPSSNNVMEVRKAIQSDEHYFKVKAQFQVANLTGGVVTLEIKYNYGGGDVLIFSDTYTDGIYQVELELNSGGDADELRFRWVTATNETALLAFEAAWCWYLGLPQFDVTQVPDEWVLHSAIDTTWTLPGA